jgi:hypothetical protein
MWIRNPAATVNTPARPRGNYRPMSSGEINMKKKGEEKNEGNIEKGANQKKLN